ncbi:hypothetical protein [Brachyspira sp.]|uniref:hypothetical protein n=1 Tax=Brachyspira sp. TaxID=1977261 RepID=UPI003D7EADF5
MAKYSSEKILVDDIIREVEESIRASVTIEANKPLARGTILMRDGDKFKPFATGDSNVASAIALEDIDSTTAGDYNIAIMVKGVVNKRGAIVQGSEAGVGITSAIVDNLRMYSIFLKDYTDIAQ